MEPARARGWPVRLHRGPITLRPLRRGDEAEWARIRNAQPDWFRMWDSSSPRTSGEQPISFGRLVTRLGRRARQGQVLPWAVDYADAAARRPHFVGQVTVSGITWGSACWAQIGYWIDRDYAGRGIIPTAVAMAADHCFSIGLHRIEIAIRPENSNSLAVVRKLGFRLEGRRERYMHVNGDWRDHDVFVLTADEVTGRVVDRLQG